MAYTETDVRNAFRTLNEKNKNLAGFSIDLIAQAQKNSEKKPNGKEQERENA